MKNKKLFLIGLILFIIGFCIKLTVYFFKWSWPEPWPQLIIDMIIYILPITFTTFLYIKPNNKIFRGLSLTSCFMFLAVFFASFSFLPPIPKFLVVSFLGYIDTYLSYLLPLFIYGYPITALGAVIIIIAIIKFIKNSTKIQG